ncbi:phage tail assembly protein [Methylobacterium sp. yr668]|uniref:phage tail assembly protein n=1 Tax=Methylobacterium sp. yr668 TaxID=1761801 RepID=UPI0008E7F41E|nr:phage tail assembly protein [Methylobacterium sp. yr668]SFT11767.1 hypothetical protein SAMN04487845_11730 [Methylobacterium sp. yr668]
MAETNEAPARDPREITWPYEHPLAAAVRAHDEMVKVLVLREPTGEEVLEFGLLEGLSADQFFPLVSKLASVPTSTLKKIGARDILSLGTVLSRFFVWAALPPAPSTTASA